MAAHDTTALPASGPIVLYDGACGLCHRSIKFILAHERDHELRFAPLQGETAAVLRARHPNIPANVDTVVFVADGRAYLRSHAFLRLARHLRRPWRWAHAFRWFPAAILDLGYRVIARIRFRIWGTADLCALPAPEQRARFLP